MFDIEIKAFKIMIDDLPIATKEMNYSCNFFKSFVKDVIIRDERYAMVIVEIHGNYPYITNQWKGFINAD